MSVDGLQHRNLKKDLMTLLATLLALTVARSRGRGPPIRLASLQAVFINGSLWDSTINSGAAAVSVSGGETPQSHTEELDSVGWG